MEFRQLRYFVAVADEANLTAASRKLHVSQPPVTRQIKQLEMELGVTLLKRSSKGVQLTAAGQTFLAEARRLLELSSIAAENCKAAEAGEIGHLDVGYFGSTIYTVIPRSLRDFRAQQPRVSVRIERASKEEQISRLRDGRLGVGFARYYSVEPDLEAICLCEERLFLATPSKSDCGTTIDQISKKKSTLIVFPQVGRPSFADEVLKLIGALNCQPGMIEAAEDVFAALAMVLIDDAVCIVPESVAQLRWPDLIFTPIEHEMAISPVNCIYLKHGRPAVVDVFLNSIMQNTHTSSV